MVARDPHEHPRVATPLELLFDLCFVVAIAQAAARLHHGLAEGQVPHSLVGFAMVFFAVWWAWVNFTWFASAYDNDDVAYRVTTFVQLGGVLVLAAGVPRAFDELDFGVVTIGYSIMRLALVAHWLRARHGDPERRVTATRYAIGVSACQIAWVALLLVPPPISYAAFATLALAELAVPAWAERAGATPWHPHHVAERYGLLTLIVIGESVLAATIAIQSAADAGLANVELVSIGLGAALVIFALWWIYFDRAAHSHLERGNVVAFTWGYGHYFVFASAAAVGAGIAVSVDQATHHAHASRLVTGAAVTIPVAIFVLATWLVHVRHQHPPRTAAYPIAAALVLAATWTPWTVATVGVLLVGLVAVTWSSPRTTH